MGGIIGWIAGKIKWLLLIAAVGGPFIAFMSWQDAERVKRIATEGVEAQASVEGATKTTRKRGGVSYSIDLAWKDAAGQDRKAEKVSISRNYSNRILMNDRIRVDTVPVKYLADDTSKDGVILRDDADQQAETDEEMIYVGAGAGLVGIVGSALFFLGGRRRKDESQEPQQAA